MLSLLTDNDYLVKSVRDGKKVRQVSVRYIGKHPSGDGRRSSDATSSHPVSSAPGGFQLLCGADALTRCIALFYDLGCQRVMFSLRSKRRHGVVHTLHDPETGEIEITKPPWQWISAQQGWTSKRWCKYERIGMAEYLL
jgi:hypothetical protein